MFPRNTKLDDHVVNKPTYDTTIPQNPDRVPDLKRQSQDIQPTRGGRVGQNKVKKITLATAICLLISILVGGAYWLTNPKRINDSGSTARSVIIEPYEDHVSAVLSDVEGERLIVQNVTSLGGQIADGRLVYDFAPHQIQDTNFYVLPKTGDGIAKIVPDASAAEKAIKMADDTLTQQGKLSRKSNVKISAGGLLSADGVKVVSYNIYTSDSAVCSLAHFEYASTTVSAHVIGSGCASINAYKDAANAAVPFYESYRKVQPRSNSSAPVFGYPEINNGANGAQRAIMYQRTAIDSDNSGMALYFRKSSTKEWQYITTALNGAISCSVATDADRQSALSGVICYDEDQNKERRL